MGARRRSTERPVGDDRRPSHAPARRVRPGYTRFGCWIPDEVYRSLVAYCAWKGVEAGKVVAPGVERELANFRVFEKGVHPRLADTPEEKKAEAPGEPEEKKAEAPGEPAAPGRPKLAGPPPAEAPGPPGEPAPAEDAA